MKYQNQLLLSRWSYSAAMAYPLILLSVGGIEIATAQNTNPSQSITSSSSFSPQNDAWVRIESSDGKATTYGLYGSSIIAGQNGGFFTSGGSIPADAQTNSNGDAFIQAFNTAGNLVWEAAFQDQKQTAGASNIVGRSLVQTANNSLVMGINRLVNGNLANIDPFLLKVSASGKALAGKGFGTVGTDYINTLKSTPNDTIIIGGFYNASFDSIPGQRGYANGQAFIAELDNSLKPLWLKQFSQIQQNVEIYDIALDSYDDSYWAICSSRPNPDEPLFGQSILMHLTAQGGLIDAIEFSDLKQSAMYKIKNVGDNHFLLAGQMQEWGQPNNYPALIMMRELDEVVWAKSLSSEHVLGSGDGYFMALETTEDGQIVAAGNAPFAFSNGLVATFNSDGSLLWAKQLQYGTQYSLGAEQFYSIAIEGKHIYLTGAIEGFSNNVNEDALLAKFSINDNASSLYSQENLISYTTFPSTEHNVTVNLTSVSNDLTEHVPNSPVTDLFSNWLPVNVVWLHNTSVEFLSSNGIYPSPSASPTALPSPSSTALARNQHSGKDLTEGEVAAAVLGGVALFVGLILLARYLRTKRSGQSARARRLSSASSTNSVRDAATSLRQGILNAAEIRSAEA